MKATLREFTGADIREQGLRILGQALDADVFCTFVLEDGQEVRCKARLKQTVGSAYKDQVIEVYLVEGLPPGAEYDYGEFAKAARHYYSEHAVKQASFGRRHMGEYRKGRKAKSGKGRRPA